MTDDESRLLVDEVLKFALLSARFKIDARGSLSTVFCASNPLSRILCKLLSSRPVRICPSAKYIDPSSDSILLSINCCDNAMSQTRRSSSSFKG